jgi:hypothetical protein
MLLALVLAACAPKSTSPSVVATSTLQVATEEIAAPAPTPTPQTEQRTVELEWPSRLRLGDSDLVRLSLIPSGEGYAVTTEFPEHRTDTNSLPITRPGGYDLYASARLDGVGFVISPEGDQEVFLPFGEASTWRWTLTPRSPDKQRLSVTLRMIWRPQPGVNGIERQTVAYSRGLDVRVDSFFGLTRRQTMTGGFLGLVTGLSLGLFALVIFVRPSQAGLKTLEPSQRLAIEPQAGLKLSSQELPLLRALFHRYSRLLLEGEFHSGYSGARAFLAVPIRHDGRTDAHTIVKIGEREAIRQEFENYENFVKDTLPPVTARIQHAPVTVRGSDRAALQYTFIAAPGHPPASLLQALMANPDPSLLLKMFDTFGPNWWMQRRPYTFRMAMEYDRMLPAHLVVSPAVPDGQGVVRTLDGRSPGSLEGIREGDTVILRNFARRELRADAKSLSLRGEAASGRPALRVRWLGLANPNGATGKVVGTRQTLLQGFIAGFDLHELPDPFAQLPDPFTRLPDLLNESVSGTQSTIHGDLNLENILVGPGGFVWLIDFAQTREGHPLYDFAHLEAEIIAHVIAAQVGEVLEYLSILEAALDSFYSSQADRSEALPSLLATLHEIAARCLFNPEQPREYQLALYMSCLGALKFANLNPFARHLLYLTAAYLASLL